VYRVAYSNNADGWLPWMKDTEGIMETLNYRGETVEALESDKVAAEVCGRIPDNHRSKAFATSLSQDLARFGSLFPNKRFFLHSLAREQLNREGGQAPIVSPNGLLPNIAKFLTPVSDRIASGARVEFQSGEITVRINRAGPQSKYPESFYITRSDAESFDVYMGRIAKDGGFFPMPKCGPDVLALLDEFECDPVAFVTGYGLRTGRCFACRKYLDDEVSIAIGCGRTCAGHYGIPWGKKALAAAVKARNEKAN
jgi:hypothetical protein